MSERVIDYTRMRKGKIALGNRRIVVCPVCGQKGAYRPPWTDQRGWACAGSVIHRQRVSSLGGFPSSAPGDWCHIPAERS